MNINFEPPFKGKSGKLVKSRYTPNGEMPKRGEELPKISTIAELQELIANLPKDLPIEGSFGFPVQPVWYNIGEDDEHMAFEEAEDKEEDEEWDDDEEED